MNKHTLTILGVLACLGTANAQTIVGWTDGFSTPGSKSSVPDTLDAHVTVTTPTFDDLEYSTTTSIDSDTSNTYIVMSQVPDNTLNDYGLAFSVTVDPGYTMDVTGINVYQQGYRRNGNNNITVGFYYHDGNDYVLVPAGTSTLQTSGIPAHSSQQDYSNNTIAMTGLTGTTQFAYLVDPQAEKTTQFGRTPPMQDC